MDNRDASPQATRSRGRFPRLITFALYATSVLGTAVFACANFLGDYATAVAISADGRTAAIGTNEGKVRLIETQSANASATIDVGSEISQMVFGADTLWISGSKGTLFAIDLRDRSVRRFGDRLHDAATYLKETNDRLFIGADSQLYSIPLSADVGESFERVATGGMSAVACPDATHVYWTDFGPQIHALELSSRKSETYFMDRDCQAAALDVNTRGQAAVGCEDGRVRFFNELGKGPVWTSPSDSTSGDAVAVISISQNAETVVSCDLSGGIRLIDAEDGATRFHTSTGYRLLIDFAANEDHRRAIVIAQYHRLPWPNITIYDLETKRGRLYDANYTNAFVYWISLSAVIVAGGLLITSFVRSCLSLRLKGNINEPEA